jgi:hypothetical protein
LRNAHQVSRTLEGRTAKAQYRKFETNIPRKGTGRLGGFGPSSYIYVSVGNLYIPLIGLPTLLKENRWA